LPVTSPVETATLLFPTTLTAPSVLKFPVKAPPSAMPPLLLPSTVMAPVLVMLPLNAPRVRIPNRSLPRANGPSRSPSLSLSVGV
jgi:hypothetical protein